MSSHVSGAVKCDAKKITSLAAIMIKPSLLGNELQWLSVTACHTETRLVTPPMSVCASSLSDFDVVTSAIGTCIQKYVIERYFCVIVLMIISQTHVQAVATVH